MSLRFEWDEQKAQSNYKKHEVHFNEALTIFGDPFLLTFFDESHSDFEDRLVSIGTSDRNRILIVVHTERGETIRIISSRKATLPERLRYENGE